MAEIYVATAAGVAGFEKQLALKVIHPNFSSDPEFVRMLVDEAKLAVQLQHANIVQTYDLGKIDDSYYIVMELIDGIDLFKILRRTAEQDHYIPSEMAVYVAHEVATGLDYAHRKRDGDGRHLQIVHRDISPQNVLVSFSGEVKIVDFGIAKARRSGSHQTAVGVIKGKYYYMSPEQAWGDPIDGRTDIFSAGILLYEMIVGEMLYHEDDFERLLDQVRKADLRPPSTRRQGVPPELDDIVMTALQRRPQDRFQTAGEFGGALSDWLRVSAPEFTPTRLGAFVSEVAGTNAPVAKARGVRDQTAEVSIESLIDEHSLIFQLSDLAANTTAGRRLDRDRSPSEATPSIDLVTAARQAPDFTENERTFVETLPPRPASTNTIPDDEFEDTTSQIGEAPLVRLDDLAPLGDDEHTEMTTRENRIAPARRAEAGALPGVKSPSVAARAIPIHAALEAVIENTPTFPHVAQPAAPRVAAPIARPAAPPRVTAPARPAPRLAASRPSLDDEPRMGLPRTGQEPRLARRIEAPPRPLRIGPDESTAAGEEPTRDWGLGGSPAIQRTESPRETLAVAGSAPPSLPLTDEEFAPPQGEVTTVLPAPRADSTPQPQGWPWGVQSQMSDVQPFPVISTPPLGSLTRSPVGRGWWIGFALVVGAAIIGLASLLVAPYLPSRGAIEVVSLPAGASVKVDGHDVAGVTPVRIEDMELKAPHRVAVQLSGYDSWEREVQFEWGQTDVTLHAALAPLSGSLKIDSAPSGAEAIVNGRFRGQTPLDVDNLLPSDEVTVELRLRGYRVERRTLEWAGKRALELSVNLDRVH